ncbi:universal stress protein [Lutimonas zeaxanthinifaciens]|uniref:universal stress protein n=1 Tax=Lutimonas zeaxanthinifaciens TaxID=3060215 RepID=UPI00265CA1C3|nr:universal stress protein [Lutimonas sp. YSD2104]WKK65651.1 universal stress protein [Lutimonas sp. YSD2104]
MKNILLTIDFDNNEIVLIDKAIEIAAVFDAKIWLLHVVAPEPDFVGLDVGPQYIRDTRAEELKRERRLLADYTDVIKLENVSCEGILIQGATIEMILSEAEKLNTDLIIIGRHEHNIMYKAFFGSVASGVIKKSKIPVMIVPVE